jgi:hypothetical protein
MGLLLKLYSCFNHHAKLYADRFDGSWDKGSAVGKTLWKNGAQWQTPLCDQ